MSTERLLTMAFGLVLFLVFVWFLVQLLSRA